LGAFLFVYYGTVNKWEWKENELFDSFVIGYVLCLLIQIELFFFGETGTYATQQFV